jgi:hypothetical protein
MTNVSSLSRRRAVSSAALGTIAALAFAAPAAAADLYTGPGGPPPAAYGPPPAPPAYVEEYAPVPVVPVPVYRPYVVGAPYWYGRPYWRGYWAPRYAGWYGRPWGYRW